MASLGLVAIVRNEAERIRPMLEAARPHLASWTICDTGSTDGTPELIEEALAGVPGQLWRDEWVNFGHNRTLAFQRARYSADWLLALDADMLVEVDEIELDPTIDAFLVDMGSSHGFSNRLPLVLAGDLAWESRGAVHEFTILSDGRLGRRAPTDAIRITMPAAEPMTSEKLEWHASLLTDALIRDPKDARSIFYLAQTRRDQGRLGEAGALYMQRAGMAGWDEETFYARWQAATFAPSWQQKADALMDAWEFRPSRLEPLYDLVAGLNARGHFHAAYHLSAVPLVRPPDTLFVWGSVYDWGLPFERAIAARATGHADEARAIAEELLGQPFAPPAVRRQLEGMLS